MSTDYDETRKRRKTSHAVIPPKPKVEYRDFVCSKCGVYWKIDYDPYAAGVMGVNGFLCRNCRPAVKKFEPSPPPRAVQMHIDEVFGAKK